MTQRLESKRGWQNGRPLPKRLVDASDPKSQDKNGEGERPEPQSDERASE